VRWPLDLLMSAASPSRFITAVPFRVRERLECIVLLGAVILLHGLVFYALQNGQTQQAAQTMPRELFVSLITPAPAPRSAPVPETADPPATKPEAKPLIKKPVKPQSAIARGAAPAPLPEPVEVPIATAAPSIDPPSPPVPAAQSAPPVPTAPAVPKTVSGVGYIQAPQPEYPPIARRRGEEGKVILHVLVNEKGHPERIDLRKSSGSEHLDEAARQAAARALFKPHLEDGKAVAVYALIPINFLIQ
jgi:periplasmic protein TonB